MAFELCLGEKRAGQLQDLVGLAQFAPLAFEFLDALLLARRWAKAQTFVSLGLPYLAPQRL